MKTLYAVYKRDGAYLVLVAQTDDPGKYLNESLGGKYRLYPYPSA